MKVKDLIAKLSALDPEMEVAILDGFNAGGQPRALNFGPTVWDKETLEEMADFDDAPDYSDLSVKEGTEIVVMGYGCY
jgi:tRNA U34 5-methylaminomethyl-2-thiouridine-forming methyltransferase MnmC